MSKITNDGLTRSGTGCFIAVPIWQQWASKGWRYGDYTRFIVWRHVGPHHDDYVTTSRMTIIITSTDRVINSDDDLCGRTHGSSATDRQGRDGTTIKRPRTSGILSLCADFNYVQVWAEFHRQGPRRMDRRIRNFMAVITASYRIRRPTGRNKASEKLRRATTQSTAEDVRAICHRQSTGLHHKSFVVMTTVARAAAAAAVGRWTTLIQRKARAGAGQPACSH